VGQLCPLVYLYYTPHRLKWQFFRLLFAGKNMPEALRKPKWGKEVLIDTIIVTANVLPKAKINFKIRRGTK
jgi:hypothetical protein